MLYITYDDQIVRYIGVGKKIKAQCNVFEREFGNVYYTTYLGQMLHIFCGKELIKKELALTKAECNKLIYDWIITKKISKVYIRYAFADLDFIELLKKLECEKVKCVLEFYMYPYDGLFGNHIKSEDFYYRMQLYKYVKLCTAYCNQKNIFNIPCAVLTNGVNFAEQKEKKRKIKNGTIDLLAVAGLTNQQGYERMIQGLHNYYTNNGVRNIIFHIVGDGWQRKVYENLVKEYNLQEHVILHGWLLGTELDDIYDETDIGIGTLGFYKLNYKEGATIKLREYCSRGIPFIYGYDDLSFDENHYYALKVSNDDKPIDIERIIKFYDEMYDGRDFISDMRKYAEESLTWDTILKPVIDYYKGQY